MFFIWVIFTYQYRYKCPDHATVLLQGTVSTRVNNIDWTLSLSIAIPFDFPNTPTKTQIPVQANFPSKASNFLQPNWLILTQYFYQLMPIQSWLSHFVNACLSKNFSSSEALEDGRRMIRQKLQLKLVLI